MMRKNITGLNRNDLLCKWKYEHDGADVYDVHFAVDYRQTERPRGTLRLDKKSETARIEWAAPGLITAAAGPDEAA